MNKVIIVNQSQEQISQVQKNIFEAFSHTTLFNDIIFRKNLEAMKEFFNTCVTHYAKHCKVFACIDEHEKVISALLFLESGHEDLSITSAFKDWGIKGVYNFLFKVGLGNLFRLLKLQNDLEKCRPKDKHIYLFLLASTKKGAGRELLDYCFNYYKGNKIYWESSVKKNNHEYYKSFGATEIGKVTSLGFEQSLFIKE